MNTKNNRRRRESVARIEKAFMELLQTSELSEITVSEICKLLRLQRNREKVACGRLPRDAGRDGNNYPQRISGAQQNRQNRK